MRESVTICKKYRCDVSVAVNLPDISLTVDLDAFVASLAEECSLVPPVFTRDQLRTRLKTAADKVVAEIKRESTKVI